MAPWLDQVAWQRSLVLDDRSFRWGRIDTDFVAQWSNLVIVRTSASGHVKIVVPHADAPPQLVEKTLRGEMAAFARSLAGGLSLHASAVALCGRALLLTGASAAGKSTMASILCESFRAELLADDVAGLAARASSVFVEPSELSVWLEDSYGTKSPLRRRAAKKAAELVALVALRFDESANRPELVRVRGAGTIGCMLDGVLRFDLSPESRGREFNMLLDLVTTVPMWQLVRARTAPREQVAELLASLVQPSTGHR